VTKSKEELIRLLKSNIKAFNTYRKETNHEAIDLSGTDLTGSNLCKADLENSDLRDTDLNFAYLHSANLKQANLSNLTIGRADMTEANLAEAIISESNLTNTILYGTNLSFVKAQKVNLEGTKIREANFSNADFSDSNLCSLDLNSVNFDNTIIKGVNFSGSNLSSAVNLDQAIFDETTIWPHVSSLPSGFDPKNVNRSKPKTADLQGSTGVFQSADLLETQEYQFLDTPTIEDTELMSFDSALIDETSLQSEADLMDFHSFDASDLQGLETKLPEIEKPALTPKAAIPAKISHAQKETVKVEPVVQEASVNTSEITDILNNILNKLNKIELDQREQKYAIDDQKNAIEAQQNIMKGHIKLIEEQKSTVEELKLIISNQQNSINSTSDAIQRNQSAFDRVESKIDILAESDSVNQIDTLLNDIAYSIKNEQDAIQNKINNVQNLLESTIKTLETETFKDDRSEITNEFYQMLVNLEANLKTEQGKSEQKIDSTTSLIENLILSMKSMQQDSIKPEDMEVLDDKLDVLTNNVSTLINLSQDNTAESQVFEAFCDFEFRIQLELEKNQSKLEGLEELFKLTFQKIDNITETVSKTTHLEDFITTITPVQDKLLEEISGISNQSGSLKDSIEEKLERVNNLISNEVSALKLSIESDIHSIKDQLTLMSDNNLDNEINNTLNKVIIETNKIDALSQNVEKIDKLCQDVENISILCQDVEKIDKLCQDVENISILCQDVEKIDKLCQDVNQINQSCNNISKIDILTQGVEEITDCINLESVKSQEMFSIIGNNINEISDNLKQHAKESGIDDEMRSVIEHLIYQLDENEKTTKNTAVKLYQKFEEIETDFQTTLKDVDRKINKINSMIRNVYKALDSLTDLIVDNTKIPTKTSSSLVHKSLLNTLKTDDDMD